MTEKKVLSWRSQGFSALNAQQLYDIFKLRQDVFILEQRCAYQDFDGNDQQALHLTAYCHSDLLAYARILGPGDYYETHSTIGRIIVAKAARQRKLGRELMAKALAYVQQRWPEHACKLNAQYYLLEFYQSFGFNPVGKIYFVDGIEHITMIKDFT